MVLAVGAVAALPSQAEAGRRIDAMRESWKNSRLNLIERFREWREGRRKGKTAKNGNGQSLSKAQRKKLRGILDGAVGDFQKAWFHFKKSDRQAAQAKAEEKMVKALKEMESNGADYSAMAHVIKKNRMWSRFGALYNIPAATREKWRNLADTVSAPGVEEQAVPESPSGTPETTEKVEAAKPTPASSTSTSTVNTTPAPSTTASVNKETGAPSVDPSAPIPTREKSVAPTAQ